MDGNLSVSPSALYARLGTAMAPIVLDVRRKDAFEGDDKLIVGAFRRPPEDVGLWSNELPSDRPVVAYCSRGQDVSQGIAGALRGAGFKAAYLEGGFADWSHRNLPTRK